MGRRGICTPLVGRLCWNTALRSHVALLDKVRLLYDRGQPTARLVVRSKQDLQTPLVCTLPPTSQCCVLPSWQDMTHCYLRAMSPIHLKCWYSLIFSMLQLILFVDLENMSVRASMSVVSANEPCGAALPLMIHDDTVNHRVWSTVGPCSVPFVWAARHASLLPRQTDASSLEPVHLA